MHLRQKQNDCLAEFGLEDIKERKGRFTQFYQERNMEMMDTLQPLQDTIVYVDFTSTPCIYHNKKQNWLHTMQHNNIDYSSTGKLKRRGISQTQGSKNKNEHDKDLVTINDAVIYFFFLHVG